MASPSPAPPSRRRRRTIRPPKPIEAWQAAARALVVRELLLQEARRLGYRAAAGHRWRGPARDRGRGADPPARRSARCVTPEADEAELPALFRGQPDALPVACDHRGAPHPAGGRAGRRAGAAMEASAPGRAADPADPAGSRLLRGAGGAPSPPVPRAQTGGHLGQIGPGQTVPEFEAALGRLPIGCGRSRSRSRPATASTSSGSSAASPGQPLPFEAVRPRIAAWLDEKVRRMAIQQYIAILAGRAEITGVEIAASPSPLVQ